MLLVDWMMAANCYPMVHGIKNDSNQNGTFEDDFILYKNGIALVSSI